MIALHAVLASTSAPQVQSLRATSTASTPMYALTAAHVLTLARRVLSARALNHAARKTDRHRCASFSARLRDAPFLVFFAGNN